MDRKIDKIHEITKGEFGNIFLVYYNNKKCILKEENKTYSTLLNEINIYIKLMSVKNIAKILDYYSDSLKNYMVLDYYNMTLSFYKYRTLSSNNYISSIKNIFKIFLSTIENIHTMGVLHRDLKPNNICINARIEPVIIDFGLSKFYKRNNKHIENTKISNIIGNHNFISKNIHKLEQPSRRDDVISCFYILIYLLINKDNERSFCGFKITDEYIKNQVLNFDINNIILFHSNIYKLSFYQKPQYKLLLSLIN